MSSSQPAVRNQPFVSPSSTVYGCWCECLRTGRGTIHQQNDLVSLYIYKNHNCLNDTSFSTVHTKCATKKSINIPRGLYCAGPRTVVPCQSFESAQTWNEPENTYKRAGHVYKHNLRCERRSILCRCFVFRCKCLQPSWALWSSFVSTSLK